MQKYPAAGAIAALKKPGRYAVGDGAYLQISKWHTRSWIFRYERLGKAHNMGLGPYPLVSLADARAKARSAKRMLLDDIDPLHAKRKARTDALLQIARTKIFKECAEQYIATHDSDWSSAKSRTAWVSTFKNYVYPKIGPLPVARDRYRTRAQHRGTAMVAHSDHSEPCARQNRNSTRLGRRAWLSLDRKSGAMGWPSRTHSAITKQWDGTPSIIAVSADWLLHGCA